MTDAKPYSARNLDEWLDVATAKLCADATTRVRLEIEGHYFESVESHRTNGCSEAEASVAALIELGDPRDADKRLRKRHLTEKQAQRLHRLLIQSRSLGSALFVDLSYLLFVAVMSLTNLNHGPFCVPIMAVLTLVLLQTIGFFAAQGKGINPDMKLLLVLDALTSGCFMLGVATFLFWDSWILVFMLVVPEVARSVPHIFLLWKLGRIEGILKDNHSRGARA